jgi:tetratricopeptide (TPR) repeat protein
LAARQFTPWEGGEGLVAAQYVHAHRALGISALAENEPEEALRHFEAARHYPHNLGEGKHLLTLERDLDYYSGLAAQKLGESELAHRYWTAAAAPVPSVGIHSYFQARALMALGDSAAARGVLLELGNFATERMKTVPKIDYFATSLPNLLLFDDDLAKRNRIESMVLRALAKDGLGESEKAVELLEKVVAEDANHLFAIEMLQDLREEGKAAVPEEIEGPRVS